MEQAASCVIEPTVVDSGLEHEEVIDETEAEAPDVDIDSVREKVSEIFNSALSAQRQQTWDDNTTLRELVPQAFPAVEQIDRVESSDSSDGIDTSSSSFDSDSSSDCDDRRAQIDGDANSRNLVAPSDLARLECFIHYKSGKLHLVSRKDGINRVFKCGRTLNSNYRKLEATPVFAGDGCLTCFNFRDAPTQGSESE